ncbi:MAG: hypothetical protein ABI120_19350 [Gemmatimonadaceae bacterium]
MTLDYTARNPLRHVLRAYDRAIHACEGMDAVAANRAIALLRASHGSESAESLGFDGIFVWCERALAEGDFAGPTRRLTTLRNAWLDAAEVRGAGSSTPAGRTLHLVPDSP